MIADYKQLVLKEYEKRRNANKLSMRLCHPTTAKFKEESIEVYESRFLKKDLRVLREFFDVRANDPDDIFRQIQCSNPDKFKSLLKYLRGESKKTSLENMEILAWLIDFQPRPYVHGMKLELLHEENEVPEDDMALLDEVPVVEEKPETLEEEREMPALLVRSPVGRWNSGVILLAIAILGATIFGVYYFRKSSGKTANESCMYWAGDHYEPVSCNKKMDGVLVIALDSSKLHGFKRITKIDTIHYQHIGKVWYCSVKGVPEFYTGPGNHPNEVNRNLRPITAYIIDKYIHPDE